MYFIGVDLGTSAVKLLLMEESGKICNIVSKEYPLFFFIQRIFGAVKPANAIFAVYWESLSFPITLFR